MLGILSKELEQIAKDYSDSNLEQVITKIQFFYEHCMDEETLRLCERAMHSSDYALKEEALTILCNIVNHYIYEGVKPVEVASILRERLPAVLYKTYQAIPRATLEEYRARLANTEHRTSSLIALSKEVEKCLSEELLEQFKRLEQLHNRVQTVRATELPYLMSSISELQNQVEPALFEQYQAAQRAQLQGEVDPSGELDYYLLWKAGLQAHEKPSEPILVYAEPIAPTGQEFVELPQEMPVIHSKGMLPSSQGRIGNCWLNSCATAMLNTKQGTRALAGLFRDLTGLGHLFNKPSNFYDGYVAVKLSKDKRDYYVILKKSFLDSEERVQNSQLWVHLLEQAYSVIEGDWASLSGKTVAEFQESFFPSLSVDSEVICQNDTLKDIWKESKPESATLREVFEEAETIELFLRIRSKIHKSFKSKIKQKSLSEYDEFELEIKEKIQELDSENGRKLVQKMRSFITPYLQIGSERQNTPKLIELFTKTQEDLNKAAIILSVLSVNSTKKILRTNESLHTGLAAPHGYTVMGCEMTQAPDGNNYFVLNLRNPWGEKGQGNYSRGYIFSEGKPPKPVAAKEVEFPLLLEDLLDGNRYAVSTMPLEHDCHQKLIVEAHKRIDMPNAMESGLNKKTALSYKSLCLFDTESSADVEVFMMMQRRLISIQVQGEVEQEKAMFDSALKNISHLKSPSACQALLAQCNCSKHFPCIYQLESQVLSQMFKCTMENNTLQSADLTGCVSEEFQSLWRTLDDCVKNNKAFEDVGLEKFIAQASPKALFDLYHLMPMLHEQYFSGDYNPKKDPIRAAIKKHVKDLLCSSNLQGRHRNYCLNILGKAPLTIKQSVRHKFTSKSSLAQMHLQQEEKKQEQPEETLSTEDKMFADLVSLNNQIMNTSVNIYKKDRSIKRAKDNDEKGKLSRLLSQREKYVKKLDSLRNERIVRFKSLLDSAKTPIFSEAMCSAKSRR